ncbi:MAG TPA: flavin reductase family protein, partial [Thermococcus sp.]|nr:flavin reductase family protein [Thermococcus sp.]
YNEDAFPKESPNVRKANFLAHAAWTDFVTFEKRIYKTD